MSFTNPTNPGDPKPVQVTNGNDPDGGLRGVRDTNGVHAVR
jgi:hypothetical protein